MGAFILRRVFFGLLIMFVALSGSFFFFATKFLPLSETPMLHDYWVWLRGLPSGRSLDDGLLGGHLLSTVGSVKSALNPALVVHGIVLTMHDARNNLSNQVVDDVRANSKEKVYATVIPRNVRVSEAPSYGKPVLVYDLKCVGSEAYLRLATEIIKRERELTAVAPH